MFKHRRKLLSQNFLKDRRLIKKLIRSSGIGGNDTVLEIGVGKGIITEGLLSVSRKVIGVEVDQAWFDLVSGRLGDNKDLKLIWGDFLEVDLPRGPYKVFANIPFSITGEIIKKLLFSDNPPVTCNLIVQKEASEKLVANKGKSNMLAILFYPWFDIKICHVFKRTDFKPVPSVDICFLQILKRPRPLVPHENVDKYRNFIIYKFTKCRSAGRWPASQWLDRYLSDAHGHRSFAKWQAEQKRVNKIHRTRTDKNWKMYINKFPE